MEINTTLSKSEQLKNEQIINTFNKKLAVNGRQPSQQLGKDDFLKILVTQLSNQDPTSPMENTEFIAQMAQFSSLEQMTNMSQNFEKLTSMISVSEAAGMLGKNVDIDVGDTVTSGQVQAVTRGANPQIQVNGMFYDLNKIKTVYGVN